MNPFMSAVDYTISSFLLPPTTNTYLYIGEVTYLGGQMSLIISNDAFFYYLRHFEFLDG
jgi:hypothetical protein